jgi:hypothetical protein
MDQAQITQSQFAEKLEEVENLQYNLQRIHAKVGLQSFAEFEEIVDNLRKFYDSTMDDLIFEANSDDPAHGCNTKWMNEVIDACKISMRDDC